MMPASIHVLGASGRSGATLCHALLATGVTPIPIVRSTEKWRATAIPLIARIADLTDPASLHEALSDAQVIVSTAHARYAPAIIAAAPPAARLILLGSTRKFTRWPDAHGNGVLAGEHAFFSADRSGVMLHPTMIYGARGEDNVQRLAALLRRIPVLPLPGGGKALVQPIHQDDLTTAIIAAISRDWDGPHSLVLAGPEPISYAGFVRAIARAAQLKPPRIVAIPTPPLIAAAPLTRLLPLLPTIRATEIRRLLEDKAFDIAPARQALGFSPMTLEEGLARTFAAPA